MPRRFAAMFALAILVSSATAAAVSGAAAAAGSGQTAFALNASNVYDLMGTGGGQGSTEGTSGADGKLSYQDGNCTGQHIRFEFDEGTGTLRNFTLLSSGSDVVMIGELRIEGFSPDEVIVEGSTFTARDGGTVLTIDDGLASHINITVEPGSSARIFTTTLFQVGNVYKSFNYGFASKESLSITKEGAFGAFSCPNGSISTAERYENDSIITTMEIDIHDSVLTGLFIAQDTMVSSAMDSAILDGIMSEVVVGEAYLDLVNNLYDFNILQYWPGLSLSPVSIGDGRIVLQANMSGATEGKVLILNMGQSIVDLDKSALEIRIDGEAADATTALEVLHAMGGMSPLYSIVSAGDQVKMLLYLPFTSGHLIEVIERALGIDLLSPASLAAEISAVTVVGIAAVAMFRKRGDALR